MQARFRNTIAAMFVASSALLAPSLAHAALVISDKPTRNVHCDPDAACSPLAPNAVLNAGDLETLLAHNGNVYVSDYAALGIVVETPVSWTRKSELYLGAAGQVKIEKPIAVAGKGTLWIDTGKLTLTSEGKVDLWDLSSNLTINGARYTLVRDIASLAAGISANPYGSYAFARDYDATPDGFYTIAAIRTTFHGVLEGLGHTVSNFSIQFTDGFTQGAFFSGSDGTIRDLKLTHIHVGIAGTNVNGEEFGGLSLGNGGLIHNVFASGHLDFTQTVDGGIPPVIGGLTASNSGLIEESGTDIDLKTSGGHIQLIGGLVAYNGGTISESYSEGKIQSTVSSEIGGLTGSNYDIVKNSYSLMAIDNPAPEGGLIHMNQGRVSSSYASGKIKQPPLYTGGIVGSERTSKRGLSDCYWNLDDGVSDPAKAVGNMINYPGGTGLTTAQFKSGLPDGFDPKIWAQNPKINKGYPYLIANPPAK